MATASPLPDSSAPQSPYLQYLIPTSLCATALLLAAFKKDLANWGYDLLVRSFGRATGKAYLSGNFAPVSGPDVLEQDLEVEGSLPKHLDGLYVRNGPNPVYKPTKGYHWFDGDGMLHGVRIRDGKAAYANHQVDTTRLRQERASGRALFPKFGDFFGFGGLVLLIADSWRKRFGGIDTTNGGGTANTALVYHAGRLLSLHEGDLPYAIRMACEGVLDTMGRLSLGDWKGPFTAHPKLDPNTGELLFFGYNFQSKPYVHAGILDPEGRLVKSWGVDVPYPTMMHDMAATKDYIVILHLPFLFDPQHMVKNNSLPFRLDKDKPSRIGLLRRDTPAPGPDGLAEVQWFDLPVPGFMAFHTATAWQEEDGTVRIFASQQNNMDLDLDDHDINENKPRLHEWTLYPDTGKSSVRCLTEVLGDFPVIHPGLTCQPTKWCYVAEMDVSANMPSFVGISKVDLTMPAGKDATVARIKYPRGCFGGEAVFVARDPSDTRPDNDDGHLLVYLYNTATDKSSLAVYDAKTMDSTPVALVHTRHRVPYGFHGMWVSGQQMREQVMRV